MKTSKVAPALGKTPSLEQFLAHYIDRSGLTQREIATACGFKRPNMVSMMKTGSTRLPLERLGRLADVLGVNPFVLYKLWMRTYYPETWDLLWPYLKARAKPLPRLPGFSPSRDVP